MALLQCGIMLAAAASGLVPSHANDATVARRLHAKPATPQFTAQQVEAYFTTDQIAYIRPGFTVKLNSLTNVGPGLKPVADISYYDDFDQPLDYAGKVTPGPLSISFILSVWDPAARQYTALTLRTRNGVTNPSADQGGTWNHVSLGHSIYTFGTTLPTDLDMTKTYTLGIYGRRTLSDIIGKDYYANNVLYDFRPDGQPAGQTFAAMEVQATCNKCHDPLAMHGGTRRTVKMCMMCHTPQVVPDAVTGNTYDFKVMIHKIHMGENLPSVEAGGSYGFGTRTDFSDVVFPQDIRNCTTCHQPSAPQGSVWKTYPSREACGSCHDDVNFATGENHPAGPQLSDDYCALCHLPVGVSEFDASITGAHTIPTKSTQLPGLHVQVIDVSDTAPGEKPTVTFKMTDDAGDFVSPAALDRFRFLFGGPTTDYDEYFREDATGASCNGDTCTFTSPTAIPTDATGTWTVTADYYKYVVVDDHTDAGLEVRMAGFNPIYNFIVTDAQPVPRREVVELDNCNQCHDVLALHGGQRFNTQECVICHNPTATADSDASAAGVGINFKWMIHKIHTGEELTRPYEIGDTSFNEVAFPGDRRDCLKCHVSGSYELPLPAGLLPTQTPEDFVPEWRPIAAACLGCHDTDYAAAHAYSNTAPFGEACASCHGEDAEFSVEKVHAR